MRHSRSSRRVGKWIHPRGPCATIRGQLLKREIPKQCEIFAVLVGTVLILHNKQPLRSRSGFSLQNDQRLVGTAILKNAMPIASRIRLDLMGETDILQNRDGLYID